MKSVNRNERTDEPNLSRNRGRAFDADPLLHLHGLFGSQENWRQESPQEIVDGDQR